jgi:two-component system LytT family response regulator
MSSEIIKTIIADDEPKARNNLLRLLSSHPEFNVVRACSDGQQTLHAIREHNPDLVFLDIQMPELSGFELLNKLNEEELPRIVFVTAYDEFALQAFEVHAIDYLMKPFDSGRFQKSLERVKKSLRASVQNDFDHSLKNLMASLRNQNRTPGKILIKESGKIFFLDTSEITRVESAGNYVKIRTTSGSHLVRETMKNMEEKLHDNTFFRIHRTVIVNIAYVKVIEPWFHGDYQVTMNDGTVLNMSRNYKELLEVFS